MNSPRPVMIGEPFSKRICRTNRPGELRRFARYRCKCGTEFECLMSSVQGGHTKSCGCLSRKAAGDRLRTHGKSGTRTYGIWCHMHKRCTDSTCKKFHLYGGRGISVCDRWKSFEAFLEDMGESPDGKSIDRKDGNGNYTPDNCRWATPKEQARNMRTTTMLTANGQTRPLTEWAEMLGLDGRVLHLRRKRGWTEQETVCGRGK